MNQLTTTELISQTKQLLNTGKELYVQIAYNLLRLSESEEWKDYGHDTFPKFCNAELEIKPSQTSKYLSIANFYVDKYSVEEIGAVDGEKLYLASKSFETPEEALSHAKTWRREDFKDDKAETPHDPEWIVYCKFCGKSQERHAS